MLSMVSRVMAGGKVLKSSQVDDELIQDLLNKLCPPSPPSTLRPPDITHVLNDPSPPLFFFWVFLVFVFFFFLLLFFFFIFFFCLFFFVFFLATLLLPCVIVNGNLTTENRVGPGMRLYPYVDDCYMHVCIHIVNT